MTKTGSKFICQQCGYESVGWLGKCPNCNSWGSLVETLLRDVASEGQAVKGSKFGKKPIILTSIKAASTRRISTKISELDRVLGGGLVPGQVILLAGEPGIGKSTLLLEVANNLGDVLYVCGEESARQIAIRAQRLGIRNKGINLLEDTDADSVVSELSVSTKRLGAIIVDSIQTMTTSDLSGMAGSVGQVRECAGRLSAAAKSRNIPLFLVGHVTKEGTVAGPAVLAHLVDTVLWFEGDKTLTLRILRAVKNRFGPTDEIGIFEMGERGLIPVINQEKIFLNGRTKSVSGSVVTSLMQGTRPILVEIEALVVPSKLAFPKRVSQGIDPRRFELLLAVLTKRCGLPLYEYDCFVNVAGGIKVEEPAADLAICLSLASAFFDKPVPEKTLALGEVSLLGEIREVVSQEKRAKEAKRLGFRNIVSSGSEKIVNNIIRSIFR